MVVEKSYVTRAGSKITQNGVSYQGSMNGPKFPITSASGKVYKPKEYTFIKCSEIFADGEYQRAIDSPRVKKIIDEYKSELYTPIKVFRRETGGYALVDGQHRLMAHVTLFGDDAYIQVEVLNKVSNELSDKTDEEAEAYIFGHQSDNTKKVAPTARVKALIIGSDPFAIEMQNIVTSAGFNLDFNGSKAKNKISAISLIWQIYEGEHGTEILTELMEVLRDAFDGSVESLEATFIRSLYLFLKSYMKDSNYSRKILVDRLTVCSHNNAKVITNKINQVRELQRKDIDKDTATINELIKIYNYKRKSKLIEKE